MDEWNKEGNPLKDVKDMQEKLKKDIGIKPLADPVYQVDFSTIDVKADPNHVNDRGEPRQDVLIYEDRLVCHPKYEDRLKEGLTLFFGNKKFNQPNQSNQ